MPHVRLSSMKGEKALPRLIWPQNIFSGWVLGFSHQEWDATGVKIFSWCYQQEKAAFSCNQCSCHSTGREGPPVPLRISPEKPMNSDISNLGKANYLMSPLCSQLFLSWPVQSAEKCSFCLPVSISRMESNHNSSAGHSPIGNTQGRGRGTKSISLLETCLPLPSIHLSHNSHVVIVSSHH